MKKPKSPADLGSGTDNILINGWSQSEETLSVEECSYHVSYLLQCFSRIVSENEGITPRQAAIQIMVRAQEQYDETYPNVYGDPDTKPKQVTQRKNARKGPWLVYTGGFETNRRRH